MKLSQTSVMCSIMVGLSPHQISAPRLLVIMSYGEPFISSFCHVFYNGWTISTPNFSPKATSSHELWRAKVCHLSQTSVMCSINGLTISTRPKATSNHELWRDKVCHLSQTSVMCSINGLTISTRPKATSNH